MFACQSSKQQNLNSKSNQIRKGENPGENRLQDRPKQQYSEARECLRPGRQGQAVAAAVVHQVTLDPRREHHLQGKVLGF